MTAYIITPEIHAQIVEAIELYHHVPEISETLAMLKAMKPVTPIVWTLTEELTKSETTTKGHLWFSDPVNCLWTPLYAKEKQ